MKDIKDRQSNIELFRIVATFMIIIVHCNGWFLEDWGGVDTWSNGGSFIVGGIRAFIQSGTCIGVDCFVLISGFFSMKPKFKSLLNLYTLLVFFYVFCYLIEVFIGHQMFSWKMFGYQFLPFALGNWFIKCYLFLLLLSPLLNSFVSKCTEKQLLLYICIYFLFDFYFGCIWDSKYFNFNNGYSVGTFILLYLIGRYIMVFGMNRAKKYSKCVLWLSFLASVFLMTVFRFVCNDENRWLGYDSPFLIISSSLLLICFASINMKKNKFVNSIATSCLAVYIFHTNRPIIGWLADIDVRLFNYYPFGLYVLYMACIIFTVFIVAIIFDKFRLYITNPLFVLLDKVINEKVEYGKSK